jgi:hypothetical protein
MLSSIPFTATQCFFFIMFAFAVGGFIRGWRRECISLIFILLAAILVHPSTTQNFGAFFARLISSLGYLILGKAAPVASVGQTSAAQSNFGPFWAILIFALIAALGYYIGNRAFPKPAAPSDRFIGIVPALIAGATFLYYLNTSDFFSKTPQGESTFAAVFLLPDPAQYVPVIFVIAIIAVVIGLISARTKKSAPPAAKK